MQPSDASHRNVTGVFILPGQQIKKPAHAATGLGANDGIRTRDSQLGKLELYQLSYIRIANIIFEHKINYSE